MLFILLSLHNWELHWAGEEDIGLEEGGETTGWWLNMAGMGCYAGSPGPHHQGQRGPLQTCFIIKQLSHYNILSENNLTFFPIRLNINFLKEFLIIEAFRLLSLWKIIYIYTHTHTHTHTYYQRVLLNCKFCFCRFGVSSKFQVSAFVTSFQVVLRLPTTFRITKI